MRYGTLFCRLHVVSLCAVALTGFRAAAVRPCALPEGNYPSAGSLGGAHLRRSPLDRDAAWGHFAAMERPVLLPKISAASSASCAESLIIQLRSGTIRGRIRGKNGPATTESPCFPLCIARRGSIISFRALASLMRWQREGFGERVVKLLTADHCRYAVRDDGSRE